MAYPIVFFRDTSCTLRFAKYHNGTIAIRLICPDGSPMATATVNLLEFLPKDHVLIKDYAENKGMLQALEAAGIVKATGRIYQCPRSHEHADLAKLLVEIKE